MLLILWAALSSAGFVAFLAGHLLGFHGVASLGAAMVILVGGEVILGDIQVKDGELIERSYTTVGNQPVENETVVNNTYQDHSWTERFASTHALGLGIFQILLGALLFYQEMEALSEI